MLYANTDDGSSALWVCDEDGVVVDNISYSIGERGPILEQINEHYGTSFTGWSDNEIGLRYGDTVPNWSAYEKISNIIYIKRNGPTIAGFIKDDTGYIYTKNNLCYIFDLQSGDVETNNGPQLNDTLQNSIIGWASAAGLTISQVEPKEENFEIGQSMQNWNNYVTI